VYLVHSYTSKDTLNLVQVAAEVTRGGGESKIYKKVK